MADANIEVVLESTGERISVPTDSVIHGAGYGRVDSNALGRLILSGVIPVTPVVKVYGDGYQLIDIDL